jgi:LysR family transcriptional regulator, cys regulon transcriptional activator
LAGFPILTYSRGFTGRGNIEKAFDEAGILLDITLAAADSDVIKTYVRLGHGVGIVSSMSYEPQVDADLMTQDLSHLIPVSTTKLAYLRQSYLPSYMRYFIGQLGTSAPNNFRLN